MFDITKSRELLLAIKRNEDMTLSDLCRELEITYNTLQHILTDDFRGYKDLKPKTKNKIKKFIQRFEGKLCQ